MRFLIILGVCLVIGFVALGNNPIREYQRDMRKVGEKYGTDEATIRTNMFIEQKQKGATGVYSGAAAQPSGPVTENDMKNSITSSVVTNYGITTPDNPSAPAVKVAQPDDQFEDNSLNVEVTQQQDPNAVVSKKEAMAKDYYPPIVGAPVAAPTGQLATFTGREPKLRSGQIIAYEGSSVFLVDQYGRKTILPDGSYTLNDGSELIVTNGRRRIR